MGIVTIAILAYVSSSEERREEDRRPAHPVHDGEALHRAPRRHRRRHPGARGRERLRPDERSARAAALLPNGPSCVPGRDHGSRQEDRSRCRREPLPEAPGVEPGRVPQACRERAPRLLPELRLLPRRQPGRQRHVRARAGPDPDQLRRRRDDRDVARHVSLLEDFQGRPRASRRSRPLGHGDARLGEVPEGRGNLGSHHFLYDFTGQKPRGREEGHAQ